MKQTAIDWMFSQLWDTPKDKFTWQSILKEAKKKEKKQIQDAYISGVFIVGFFNRESNSKQYYQEIYEEK